ncbi:hypothetical protein Plhal703r1_c13g0066591 [Plasmopara halstedii]
MFSFANSICKLVEWNRNEKVRQLRGAWLLVFNELNLHLEKSFGSYTLNTEISSCVGLR